MLGKIEIEAPATLRITGSRTDTQNPEQCVCVCVCVHEHVYFLDFKNRSAHPQAVSFPSGPRRCGFRSNKSIQCLLRVLCDVLERGANTKSLHSMFLFLWAQLLPLLLSRAMWSHTHWQVPIHLPIWRSKVFPL